jgi:shikimate dehydrogenase
VIAPVAGVVGWPIRHSRSPLIHRYWLRQLGIDGDYVPIALRPAEATGFFSNFSTSEYVGANVTVPHKETAFESVDFVESAAEALGAVNTIWLDDDGRLAGTNTDAAGFLANLDMTVPGWAEQGKTAVVLGAGGAARAVVWALLQRGFDPVIIVNRSGERAKILADRFGKRVIRVDWSSVGKSLRQAHLLVNATSLGMAGQPSLPLDISRLRDDSIVTDLVYAPLETGLLLDARARGLRTVDGLGMLLHQAVPGFEKWFGARPEVTTELRDLVITDLARPS